MSGRREYGDYQTPIDFAKRVCHYLKDYCHIKPSAIVEPTCGVGNFLKSSLLFEANEYYGIEINPKYCEICRNSINDEKVNIINSDFFTFSSKALIKDKRQILVIGNPPWITNSTLSTLGSDNLPIKTNFKGLKGIDAITGASNFDICEYIILQLIKEYRDTNAIISMLCKTSVARNVFKELKRNYISFASYNILKFDASKVFGISASACLLVFQLSDKPVSSDVCNVYEFEYPETIKSQFGYLNGQFYSDLDTSIENFDGQCCFEWRQGVKHDCSKIMELTLQNGTFQNGQKETIQIEDDIVFPLIKSSMFKAPVIHSFSKFVIVTQKKVREETKHLEQEVPKTWKYLNDHIKLFENRKSSIYRGTPPFSMFGVGDYSYSKYKVGVSGFYKQPLFSVLYSDDSKPVMIDDTSYFICFDSYDMAYTAMLLLNSEKVQKFLTSIAFLDTKRPYTKKVLERIDFNRIVKSLTFDELVKTERNLNLSYYITLPMYDAFKSLLDIGSTRFA
ncbi:MAG: methyltransferase [Lachnospiraceae bacterium]|jgi:16S rRNA A1518/A1519 N6-dimethyltransferase RsmA/KsgA/DIM1 with predicted DNA glycosylase/AP lyase activity|nr:methyltransferase [Lachnospiraceae bacterium]